MATGEIIIDHGRQAAELGTGRSLLSVLREDLHLTGAKPACGEGACGACTVLLEGVPVRACITPAVAAAGREVRTIEGLGPSGCSIRCSEHFWRRARSSAVTALRGWCSPRWRCWREPGSGSGRDQGAMAGNVCRCGGYPRIERASFGRGGVDPDHEPSPPAPAAGRRPRSAWFWEFRPASPWDLTRSDRREYFDLLGDGLVVVFEPTPCPGPVGPRRLAAGSFAPPAVAPGCTSAWTAS